MVVGCELCGSMENLLRCSGCKCAYYCSKEHQRLHWRKHKSICKETRQLGELHGQVDSGAATAGHSDLHQLAVNAFAASEEYGVDDHLRYVTEQFAEQLSATTVNSGGGDFPVYHHQREDLLANGLSGQMMDLTGHSIYVQGTTSDCDDLSVVSDHQNRVHRGGDCGSVAPPYLHRNMKLAPTETPLNNSVWMHTMCQYVIRDMDNYGICVIDNFAGVTLGMTVLEEVLAMYSSGQFMDGKLMNNPSENFSRSIRGDKILWVTGQEDHCKNIGLLIKLVDSIVLNSNRMPRNGMLGRYTISDRSKAMVACYPGHGTQYVKHVDNPNKDGRCITSIYYLNKDWDVKKDGGLLRIFPRDWSQVADIEPTFDRILFFWSDRRNPHEVQPALRTRYAITLWYNDKTEKEAALGRLQNN